MNYSAIPSGDNDNGETNGVRLAPPLGPSSDRRRGTAVLSATVAAAAVVLALGVGFVLGGKGEAVGSSPDPSDIAAATLASNEADGTRIHSPLMPPPPALPMPKGVNLGSWLSLEDYFYVGRSGAVEVATPDGWIVGKCLPPLHVGPSSSSSSSGTDGKKTMEGPTWNSETDLYMHLARETSVARAIKTFHAFRVAYMDWDDELPRIKALGIDRVRVPVTWCLTDHDPTNDELLAEALLDEDLSAANSSDRDAELERRYTCLDPFFANDASDRAGDGEDIDVVRWPAVPRPFLAGFLRACGRHGVKATIDVHTYPGGTSPGTFSGVWPRKPLFWKYDHPKEGGGGGDDEDNDADIGRRIFGDLIRWLEQLALSDPDAFLGLGAVTPMNEPAHLSGLYGPGGPWPPSESYLPPLPDDVAREYLGELNAVAEDGRGGRGAFAPVPDGPHLRPLKWQGDAVSTFRSSSLPSLGIEVHVNVHESILAPSLVPGDGADPGGRHPFGTAILASWWRGTTTPEERSKWAVLDMHHYHAWEPACQGSVDGPPLGNYTCGDVEATADALSRCASWAGTYRSIVNEQMQYDAVGGEGGGGGGGGGDGDGSSSTESPPLPAARLASAEFSASTHHSVLRSCTDVTTLRSTYEAQVGDAIDAGVELYFWSWKMPHGGAFRPAWSFQNFLYLMGEDGFNHPDESVVPCGE